MGNSDTPRANLIEMLRQELKVGPARKLVCFYAKDSPSNDIIHIIIDDVLTTFCERSIQPGWIRVIKPTQYEHLCLDCKRKIAAWPNQIGG